MIRLFAAVAIPNEIASAVAAAQQSLRGARWRDPSSLHVTLHFAGDIAEPDAGDLSAELARVSTAPFALRLSGVGAFEGGGRARAVWAAVAPSQALEVLAGRCRAAARRAGLAVERRRFRPHVTLAYLRAPDGGEVAAWIGAHNLLQTPWFEVSSFGLYSSRPSADGPDYRLERLYRLA